MHTYIDTSRNKVQNSSKTSGLTVPLLFLLVILSYSFLNIKTVSAVATLTERASIFLQDSGGGVDSTTLYTGAATSTTLTNVPLGVRLGLRVQIDNTGDATSTGAWKLQYENSDFSNVWTDLDPHDTLTSSSSGLVGYWTFDESDMSGGVQDRSVFSNVGALLNQSPTTTVPGKIGTALDFDGVNDGVNLGSGDSIDGHTVSSICAWVKPDAIGSDPRIFVKADGNGLNGIGLLLTKNGANNDIFFRRGFSGQEGRWQVQGSPISLGSWQHICVTYDASSSSNDPLIYLNTVSQTVTETFSPSGSESLDDAYDAYIGNRPDAARPFDGGIDEVRYYQRLLTADEIKAIYIAGQHTPELSSVGAYKARYGSQPLASSTVAACSGGTTYTQGRFVAESGLSTPLLFGPSQCAELTYLIDTTGATLGKTYRFRVAKATTTATSTVLLDSYANYPTLTTVSSMTGVVRIQKEVRGGGESSTLDPGSLIGKYTSLAIGSDGYPVITYYDESGSDLEFLKCNDISCTTQSFRTLDTNIGSPPDAYQRVTSLAIGSDGFPVVAYTDYVGGDLEFVKCNDLACTSITQKTLDASAGTTEIDASIAIGADGYPVIAYRKESATDVLLIKCNDISCTTFSTHTINTAGSTWDPAVTIGQDGFPVVSYSDLSTYYQKYAKCHDTTCSSVTETNMLNSIVGDNNIITGPDGYSIFLSSNDADSLLYFKCMNLLCTNSVQRTLDASIGEQDGSNISLAIGIDGLLTIAYWDLIGGDLEFIKCNDATCASVTKRTLDGNVGTTSGAYPGLAIGTDGYPVISYYDDISDTLKLFRCSSTDCAPLGSTTAQLPNNLTDLAMPLDDAGYTRVATSNDTYDSIQGATSTSIAYQLAVTHSNNTDPIVANWEGQLSVATSTYLQIWDRTAGVWVGFATNTSPTANTDFILDFTITSDLGRYYDSNNEYRIRLVTATTTAVTTLKTDTMFVGIPDPSISYPANLEFYVGAATTSLDTFTIANSEATASSDIRITIATTTTNFRFDTNTTSLTFGGTASGKVSNPVSYADGGATLVIPVDSNFTATNTLSVSGINVGSFVRVSTSTSQFGLQTDGNSTGTPSAVTEQTVRIKGLITIGNHDAGQTSNKFNSQNQTDATFLAFKLTPTGENATTTDLVVTLSGIQGTTTSKLSNLKLYRDNNNDGSYDGGDTLIDNGILTSNGQHGAITFSTDFLVTTGTNYIVTGNTTSIIRGEAVVFSLSTSALTSIGSTTNYQSSIIVTVSSVQHERYGAGGGGGSTRIDGPPAGAGTVTGGSGGVGEGAGAVPDGENITSDPDFYKPTATGAVHNEWTNGANAYLSNGTYATAASSNLRQTYSNFGFNIPDTNVINGIAVKLDASGTTQAGTIDIAISWDNGSSYTTAKATPTLSDSDIVYTVGSATDTWGRTWTPSEFNTGNFQLRVTAQISSNTLRLDALEVRVYHQAGGGGGGAGGRI